MRKITVIFKLRLEYTRNATNFNFIRQFVQLSDLTGTRINVGTKLNLNEALKYLFYFEYNINEMQKAADKVKK